MDPTPAEAAAIALSSNDTTARYLSKFATKLGITNIRTIRRTQELVRRIEPTIARYDHRVLEQAVQTLTLLCWSLLEPTSAPGIEFISKTRASDAYGGRAAEEVSPDEARWNALLDAYGPFTHLDAFDTALFDLARTGILNETEIERLAAEIHDLHQAGGLKGRWRDAWRDYGTSMGGTEDEVLGALQSAFFETITVLTVGDVNAIVSLFRDFGREADASEMLDAYLETVNDKPYRFFDLSEHRIGGDAFDPGLSAAFESRFASKRPPRALEDALTVIGKGEGWNAEDEEILSHATVDDIYELLRSKSGSDFSAVVAGATHWWRVVNTSDEMREFSARVREAMVRLASESRLNAKRLQRFGIKPASEQGEGS